MAPLKLNGSSSGYVAVEAPASAGSNTLTLPTSNGSANQYLKNGSTPGTLEFGSVSAGKILQVVNAKITSIQTVSLSSAFADTDVTAAITPASASNKILVSMFVAGEGNASPGYFSYRLNRAISGGATTAITAPTAGSRRSIMGVPSGDSPNSTSTIESFSISNYYDEPAATTAVTYTLQMFYEGSATWYLNRTVSDTDAAANRRGMSWVTLMEVSG
jgi:hypothetical protein